jgi:hypothetical protein
MESPAESIAFRIPIWASPLAPPPLNVSPIFGLLCASESCEKAGKLRKIIRKLAINRIRIERKIESLLIVKKVCHKITQRR